MDSPIKNINLDNNSNIDKILQTKMIFLYNALDEGWTIKRNKKSYILTKKHENKKEVYNDLYLTEFITANMHLK